MTIQRKVGNGLVGGGMFKLANKGWKNTHDKDYVLDEYFKLKTRSSSNWNINTWTV